MKVVITSATEKEIVPVKQQLHFLHHQKQSKLQISFHESGVGILASCFSIAKLIFSEKPDLIIQAGIAGAFDNNLALGKVVTISEEILADTGVEENGSFKDLFDLNLQQPNLFPFTEKRLPNPYLKEMNYLQLDEVRGVTINEITTRATRISDLKEKYHPTIESMEGASLHYCCLQTSTSFIQIRSVSNYIGERDKSKWNFRESLENLAESIIQYIEHVESIQ